MRKLVAVALALAFAGLNAPSAEAGLFDGLRRRSEPQATYYQAADGNYYYYTEQQPQFAPQYVEEEKPNLFEQLWEMEQRKNAWLRRTFFGG